jgi:hypothetical protein
MSRSATSRSAGIRRPAWAGGPHLGRAPIARRQQPDWRGCPAAPCPPLEPLRDAPDFFSAMAMGSAPIPIANDILRRLLPAVCLGELTRNPLAARMRGHAQPQNLTAGMPQDQKSIQQPERDRGDHEQIHRRDAVRVISKKRLPSLEWRTSSSRHVLGNGGSP